MSHAGVDVLPYNVRLNDPSPNINLYFACDSAMDDLRFTDAQLANAEAYDS